MTRPNPNTGLDPRTQYREIYRNLSTLEFPWDINQALSFALFRTYAVPSIGRLLDETGELGGRSQRRYDDTVILLETPLIHGFDSEEGRTAMRRINRMHRAYDIGNDDLVYTLATFVVTPVRWIERFGWRQLTGGEIESVVRYYGDLGRHMALRDVPQTYDDYARFLDDYEAERFAYDEGGRRVADATMRLLASFYPRPLAPAIDLFSRAVMEDHLLDAFRYRHPSPAARRVVNGAMRVRARALAHMPPRRRPQLAQKMSRIKSYPGGYRLDQLGTFPTGCPVPHGAGAAPGSAVTASADDPHLTPTSP